MMQISRLARDLPYLLRIVILVLFFNGLFAFITTLLSSFSANGFFPDPRIVNILIAFWLAQKNKLGYVLGIISIGINIFLHSVRLLAFGSVDFGIMFYFLTALVIDIFQFYVLLKRDARAIYFVPRKQSEL